MILQKILLFSGLILCSHFFMPAEAAIAPAFSIQMAINQALEKNPDYLKAKEAELQSQADTSAAVSKLFPTVYATGQSSYQKDASNSSSASFGGNPYNQYAVYLLADQPLFDGGALFAGLRYAKKDKKIKELASQIVEKTLGESVIENFYSVLLYERLVEIYKDAYSVYKQTLQTAEREYKIGRTQKLDLLQIKTQTALMPPKITQAQNQLEAAAAQLATLLRNLDSNQVSLKGALVSPDPNWVRAELHNKASELPEITQSRLLVEQVADSRDVQLATNWPKLSLDGQIGRKNTNKSEIFSSSSNAWSLALNLNIPLFSGLSSVYQRRSLSSQERQIAFNDAKINDTVLVKQIQTENDLKVAADQLNASNEAARFGRESLHEAEKEYKLKQIDYLHYQTSQQAFLDSESGFYQAKYNYIIAIAKHFNAVGIPLSTLIAELDRLGARGEQ